MRCFGVVYHIARTCGKWRAGATDCYVRLPSSMRSRSGQPCSLCRAGDLCVLRPARRIHIRRRGRVLHNSPPPASVRPATAPTVTAHGTLVNWANAACVRLSLRGTSASPPARCIHRSLRDTSSAGYRLLVSLASVGASRELSSRRSSALIPHTCAVSPTFRYGAFPFVASALADLSSARLASCDRGHASIRRKHRHYPTLIDPITAGRRLRGKSVAQAANNAQTGVLQRFRGVCPQLLHLG